MRDWFRDNSGREFYRLASTVLIVLIYGPMIAIGSVGGPDWVKFSAAVIPIVLLLVLTDFRMRDAAYARGWVLLLVVHVSIGPYLEIADVRFYASHLIHLCPILIGWCARSVAQDDTPGTSDQAAPRKG
ncbi:MAG: hypothetical protein QNJ15_02770 [Erythrobacter sp.]|nr:hypothetical protein [Erythrobacter sp.]